MSGYVFVSYSHTDAAYVRKLGAYLSAAGVPVWIDNEIITGDRWASVVRGRVERCAAMIVVMSPTADESVWVEREILHAQNNKRPIYPLLLSGQPLFHLVNLHHENVAGGRMPSADLLARLRTLVDGHDNPTASEPRGDIPRPIEATPCLTIPGWRGTDSGCSAAFSPDGHSLAVAVGGNTIRVYDTATWRLRRTLHQRWNGLGHVRALAWCPDGSLLTGASYMPNFGLVGPPVRRVIQRWNAATGDKQFDVAYGQGDEFHVHRMAVSPDGARVATCPGDITARVWNVWGPLNRHVLVVTHLDVVQTATFSPDGQWLVTAGGGDKTARTWDLVTGEQRLIMRHREPVTAAVVSPDGTRLLTAGAPPAVWDSQTGERLGDLATAGSHLTWDVAFSPNGRWMAAAGNNSTASIWDGEHSLLLTVQHGRPVRLVQFSPDGHLLLTVTADGTTRVWRLRPAE